MMKFSRVVRRTQRRWTWCCETASPQLIFAAAHLDVVERLLEQNADTEALGTLKTKDLLIEGCTRLWIAATEGQLDVVKV